MDMNKQETSHLMQAIAVTTSERKQLETMMRKVFKEEMRELSQDLQSVLIDDIVTAFLNRISVFHEIEAKTRRYTRTKRILNT
jgi:hypothetical protein